MLYAYPRPRGRDGGYAGLPAAKPPGYPLKPQGWPSTRLEGQAGTRDSLMQYIGVLGCVSPPRLGPDGPAVLTAGPPSRRRARPSPSFLTVGRWGPCHPPTFLADPPGRLGPPPSTTESGGNRTGRRLLAPPVRSGGDSRSPPHTC